MENSESENEDNAKEDEEDNNDEALNLEINIKDMNGEMILKMENVLEKVNMKDMKESKIGQDNENISKDKDSANYGQQKEINLQSLKSLSEHITNLQGWV